MRASSVATSGAGRLAFAGLLSAWAVSACVCAASGFDPTGKPCSAEGTCLPGYRCEPGTWTCQPVEGPDAAAHDGGGPDSGSVDSGVPDAGRPDAGAGDGGVSDGGKPDAGQPDGGGPCTPGESRACGSAIGECRQGTQTCDASGQWGPCLGGKGPEPETCDGLDNDCDGTPDNIVGNAAWEQSGCSRLGICASAPPPTCVDAAWTCNYPPGYQPTERACDGLDNDCDGMTDNITPSGAACTQPGDCLPGETCVKNVCVVEPPFDGTCEACIADCSSGCGMTCCVHRCTAADGCPSCPGDCACFYDCRGEKDACNNPQCKNGSSCYAVCDSGDCQVNCDGLGCEVRCLPGTENCTPTCQKDSACAFVCSHGDVCKPTCAGGSTCDIRCTGSGPCQPQCKNGATCIIHCASSDKNLCQYTCESGANCTCSGPGCPP